MKKIYLPLFAALALSACKTAQTNQQSTEPKEVTEQSVPLTKLTPAQVKHEGIDLENMDTSLRPQDDFYNFVNGKWMQKAKVPADRGRWGSFDQLREKNDEVSLKILKNLLNQQFAEGSDEKKVADLYQSIMDTVSRDKAGLSPIQGNLDRIDMAKSLKDITNYLIAETPYYDNELFDFGVGAHPKNSNQNAVYLGSGSLGMNRDYYQKKDKESQSKLEAYREYLVDLFKYMKDPTPEKSATAVLDFEKQIASNLLGFEDLRDAEKQYNPVKTKDLSKYVKNVDLQKFLKGQGVNVDEVLIPEIKYYKNFDKLYNQKNLFAIKKYLKAHVVNGASSALGTDLDKLRFNFYSKKLNGIEKMRDRDKRALGTINDHLGEAFGKLYVKEVFPPEAKERASEMIDYLKKSYKKHINESSWMTPATKQKALEKLAKFTVKIGYPDKWKDYSAVEIKSTKDGGSYYQNLQNLAHWNFQKDIAKIGKPVDKTEWHMSPQTVNAYYNPSYNEIVFPAAILQPPFFNFKADAGVNFGGIGAVIGHEISHGFDDSGAKFDGDGNLNNWWTKEDETKFNQLGKALAAQFNAYEPFPGINVNGEATLGENIADLGGVNVAYDALQLYLKDHGNPGKIDGFTPEQRFFISWGTIWRTKTKDESLKNQIKTDFHAPGIYRATAPLENINAFYEAFDIQPNDKMYKSPEKRIVIW